MESAFKRDLRNYPLYFLLWTVLGLFYFSQGVTQRLLGHDPTPWWHYLVGWLLGVYIWAFLTPIILLLGRQLHLFPTFIKDFRGSLAPLLVKGFHGNIVNYWIVLGLQWGVLYYQRYQERSREVLNIELRASELQSQLVGAQLNALKMQLQPHFLFNTLNAITVLVRQQKSKDAERMLGHLSDLLRGVLEDVDTQEISLRRELEYLQLYLAIEQVRFADRLRVEVSADPAVQEASVPQLILQPIVENAIRHGIGRSSSAGRVLISASKIDGKVELRVQDDGPGLSPGDGSNDQGIGLANTRARLQQLYGQDAGLEIKNCDLGGVIVTMSIPFHHSHIENRENLCL